MSTIEQVQEPVVSAVEQTEQAPVAQIVDEKSSTNETATPGDVVEEAAEPEKTFVPAPVPVASPWKVVDVSSATTGGKKVPSVAEAVEELKSNNENKSRNNQLLRSSSKDRWVPLHANITVSTKQPNSSPRQGSGKPKSNGTPSGPQRATKKKRTTNKRKQTGENETNGEELASDSISESSIPEDSKASSASASSKKPVHGNGVSKRATNKSKPFKKTQDEASIGSGESSETAESSNVEENATQVSETEGADSAERKPFSKRQNGYSYSNGNNNNRPFSRNGNGPRRSTQPRHHHNTGDGSSRPGYYNNNNGYRKHHNNYGYGQFPSQNFGNGTESQSHFKAHHPPSPYFAIKKVAKQLQYYFGEQNLTKDAYLKNQFSSKNGFIPLSLISKFYRVVNLSYGGDPNIILGALHQILSSSPSESNVEVAVLKENLENDNVLSKYVIRSNKWEQFLGEESQDIDYDLEKTVEAADLASFEVEAPVFETSTEEHNENNIDEPQAHAQSAKVIEQSA
ncbi:hypothetical protein ACO0RG_001659 [Hanseniaspora osmophila]|uniref:RNA-binding protein SRO9 n=1 Tax=Hanseniaspora osmophila TaxID=56408 RepID=A0A1E5RI07_9ASCO|nr:RNA-binding protein SRO9 [Hanseniaspora osmophila]